VVHLDSQWTFVCTLDFLLGIHLYLDFGTLDYILMVDLLPSSVVEGNFLPSSFVVEDINQVVNITYLLLVLVIVAFKMVVLAYFSFLAVMVLLAAAAT
jgi:hypothetical protein